MTEKELYNKYKKYFKSSFLFRVENSCTSGMPDVFCIKSGKVLLIENKIIKQWDSQICFQNSQPIFIYNYIQAGGNVCIIFYAEKEKEFGFINCNHFNSMDYLDCLKNKLKNAHKQKLFFENIESLIFP